MRKFAKAGVSLEKALVAMVYNFERDGEKREKEKGIILVEADSETRGFEYLISPFWGRASFEAYKQASTAPPSASDPCQFSVMSVVVITGASRFSLSIT